MTNHHSAPASLLCQYMLDFTDPQLADELLWCEYIFLTVATTVALVIGDALHEIEEIGEQELDALCLRHGDDSEGHHLLFGIIEV